MTHHCFPPRCLALLATLLIGWGASAQEPLTPLSSASSSSSASSTSPPEHSLQCEVTSGSTWGNGFVYSFTLTNTGTQTVDGWELTLVMPEGYDIDHAWGANISGSSPEYQATPKSWNDLVGTGQSVSFGVQGGHDGVQWSDASSPEEPLCFAANQDPRGDVQASVTGQTVLVDALGFIDSFDDPRSVFIDWGDGHSVYGAHEAWHTYFFAGEYTITVDVRTDSGTESQSVSVEAGAWTPDGNHAPVAMLAPYHTYGNVSLVSITADPDGDALDITEYGSNSAFNDSESSSSSSSLYSSSQGSNSSTSSSSLGSVSEVLTVFDGELGATVQESATAFNGYIDYRGVPKPLFRTSGLTLWVNGGYSLRTHDISWDLGDGSDRVVGPVATHTYDAPGEYDVTLYAYGLPFTGQKTVTVTLGDQENTPPSAEFSCIDRGERDPLGVNCSPGSEYDSDGDVLKFEWSMGDGSHVVSTSLYKDIVHRYQSPGTYEVTLKVFDGEDSAEQTTTVTVPGESE